jgi:hypothetical protein
VSATADGNRKCEPVKGVEQPKLLGVSGAPEYQVHRPILQEWWRSLSHKERISTELRQHLVISLAEGGAASFIRDFLQNVETSMRTSITYQEESTSAMEISTYVNTKVEAFVDTRTCATTIELPLVLVGSLDIPDFSTAVGTSLSNARTFFNETSDSANSFMQVGRDGHVGDRQFRMNAKTPHAAVARAFGLHHVLGWRSEGNSSMLSHNAERRLFSSDTVTTPQYFATEFRERFYIDSTDFFGFDTTLHDGPTIEWKSGFVVNSTAVVENHVSSELNISLSWQKAREAFSASVKGSIIVGNISYSGDVTFGLDWPDKAVSFALKVNEQTNKMIEFNGALDLDGDGQSTSMSSQYDVYIKDFLASTWSHSATEVGEVDTHFATMMVQLQTDSIEKWQTASEDQGKTYGELTSTADAYDSEAFMTVTDISGELKFDRSVQPSKATGQITGTARCEGVSVAGPNAMCSYEPTLMRKSCCDDNILFKILTSEDVMGMTLGEPKTENIDMAMEDVVMAQTDEKVEVSTSNTNNAFTMTATAKNASTGVTMEHLLVSITKTNVGSYNMAVTIKGDDSNDGMMSDLGKFEGGWTDTTASMSVWMKDQGKLVELDYSSVKGSTNTAVTMMYEIKDVVLINATGSTGNGECQLEATLHEGNDSKKLFTFRGDASAKADVAKMNLALLDDSDKKLTTSIGSFDNSGDVGNLNLVVKGGEQEDEVLHVTSIMPKSSGQMSGTISLVPGGVAEDAITLKGSSDIGFMPMSNAPAGWNQLSSELVYDEGDVDVQLSTYFLTNPDGDFNSFGMEVALDNLNVADKVAKSKTSWTISFPYGTPAAAPQATSATTFDATMTLATVSDFNPVKYADAVASKSGVSAYAVEIVSTEFTLGSTYTFSSAVSADEARLAIADSCNVAKSQVAVEVSKIPPSRRLSSGTMIKATIKVSDQATAASLKSNMADRSRLNAVLTAAGLKDVTVTAAPAPTVLVKVTTKVNSYDGEQPVAVPDSSELSSDLGLEVKVSSVEQQNYSEAVASQASNREMSAMVATFFLLLVVRSS